MAGSRQELSVVVAACAHMPDRKSISFVTWVTDFIFVCTHGRTGAAAAADTTLDPQLQKTPADITSYTGALSIPKQLQGAHKMSCVHARSRRDDRYPLTKTQKCVCVCVCALADRSRTCQPP